MKYVKFADLLGKTLAKVEVNDPKDPDELLFEAEDGSKYKLYHSQDCCESVSIEDICGDLNDLVGSEILLAEESSGELSSNLLSEEEKIRQVHNRLDGEDAHSHDESYTWTFYRVRTLKGSVVIRWYGSSNGYYSEGVDFVQVAPSRRE